ncbi:MAG: hypothetical protein NVSMB39_2790 [Candidatus Saccharimonadales bacterium]
MDFVRGGQGDNPRPIRELSTTSAAAAKQKIQAFLSLIKPLSSEQYPCKAAYVAFERERLAAFELILAAEDVDAVAHLNDELFGSLNDMGAPAAVSHLLLYIEKQNLHPAVEPYRQLVLEGLYDLPRTFSLDSKFTSLNDYRLQLRPLAQRPFGFVSDLLDTYNGDALTSEQVRDVLQTTLENTLGEGRDGWKAAVSPGAPNVFINAQHREVTIPAHRQYTKSHVDTLAVHEIGVHVQRSVHGDLSKERLAGFGLAGYGPIEEAFGVLLGNAAKDTYHQINSLIPFAVIAFAGNVKRPTFRQVHEFARALIICLANPDAAKLQEKYIEYGRAAFSRTVRVLRLGHSGLIERSTTKYWRGQLMLAEHFDARGLNRETFDDFFAGKYDCLEPTQLNLIREHRL